MGAIVEVNCETDFVAKNEDFQEFAAALAELVATRNPADVAALSALPVGGATVEQRRTALLGKIGENLSIRRFARIEAKGRLSHYVHGGAKIGVLVDVTGGDEQLGRDLAMHIAASKPKGLSKDDVPADLVEKERSIAAAKAAESGKPADIVAKMVEGSVQKFLKEATLLGQPFVKKDKQSVDALLKANSASVSRFVLYVVGEGIEKKSGDFAAEVMAQVNKAKKDEDQPEKTT
jgi:elongation factor Ts